MIPPPTNNHQNKTGLTQATESVLHVSPNIIRAMLLKKASQNSIIPVNTDPPEFAKPLVCTVQKLKNRKSVRDTNQMIDVRLHLR